ncbi:MAG: MucB/RseB C-terminal domain-containing protein [Burkholderiaceae bacterium]|nr:MucB/RseB C-terminal domain-containing protein [Burkholderiaceae bacterium]
MSFATRALVLAGALAGLLGVGIAPPSAWARDTGPSPVSATPAPPSVAAQPSQSPGLNIAAWLQRMYTASRQRSYTGTFVVSASNGELSSARIWHVCEGNTQVERVETLSGTPRTMFRHNGEVLVVVPQAHIVRRENRQTLDLFPGLSKAARAQAPDINIARSYSLQPQNRARVAGFDADVIRIVPHDKQRFGYRAWIERKTGLPLKLQTLDAQGKVVEQSAFSDLRMDAPIKAQTLLDAMAAARKGYKIEQMPSEPVAIATQGWSLHPLVPGFHAVGSYQRIIASTPSGAPAGAVNTPSIPAKTLQWVFSDGLASISLFIEPCAAQCGKRPEGAYTRGATSMLTRRMAGPNNDHWWLLAVGEVPPQTLATFAENLQRTH